MPVKLNKARIKRQIARTINTEPPQPTQTIDFVASNGLTVTNVPCYPETPDVLLSGDVLEEVYRRMRFAEDTEQIIVPFKAT